MLTAESMSGASGGVNDPGLSCSASTPPPRGGRRIDLLTSAADVPLMAASVVCDTGRRAAARRCRGAASTDTNSNQRSHLFKFSPPWPHVFAAAGTADFVHFVVG